MPHVIFCKNYINIHGLNTESVFITVFKRQKVIALIQFWTFKCVFNSKSTFLNTLKLKNRYNDFF